MLIVNVHILGIGELTWTRMGEFNSDDHYRYNSRSTVGKKPLEEMGQPSQSTKESEMQYLGATSKMTE